jgi:DNA-binding response OmpR family regulator
MEKRPHILIIEDDDLNQQLYELLFGRDYTVDLCKNSEEFAAKLNSKVYDIFIVDITLEGTKNGLELIEELRLKNNYKHTPVIVVTANAFKKDEIAAVNAGATLYFKKPFRNKELLGAIKNLLNQN